MLCRAVVSLSCIQRIERTKKVPYLEYVPTYGMPRSSCFPGWSMELLAFASHCLHLIFLTVCSVSLFLVSECSGRDRSQREALAHIIHTQIRHSRLFQPALLSGASEALTMYLVIATGRTSRARWSDPTREKFRCLGLTQLDPHILELS